MVEFFCIKCNKQMIRNQQYGSYDCPSKGHFSVTDESILLNIRYQVSVPK